MNSPRQRHEAPATADVVIAGGGVTAHRCAFRLRELGYQRRITLLCAETVAPYDRTALSKAALGPDRPSPAELSAESTYRSLDIELKLGATVSAIRPVTRTIVCQDGTEHRYDKALIATGARPVLPPNLRVPGVHTLRETRDLPALIEAAASARRIAVIGGGLIGCELSSSLCRGSQMVTMIEAAPGPLYHVAGEDVALRLLKIHRAAGINLLTNSTVGSLRQGADRHYEVRLTDGTRLKADCVVVAIGARPACSWLSGSDIPVDDGIVTDEYCETVVPDVFAAGDCARFPSRRLGRLVRLEHWDSAARHGIAAAENMLGERRAFDPIPFFWSDQHEIKLAMAGLPSRGERLTIDQDADSLFATFNGPAGPTAGVGLNRTRQVVELRRRLEGESQHETSQGRS